MVYFLLFLALTCNAVANILIKFGAEKFSEGIRVLFSQPSAFFTNGYFFLGLVFFGVALVLYSIVLSKMPLSIAYPIMTSMGFMIVVGFSSFYLHEVLHWWQWLGILLILGGVVFLSYGFQN